MTEKKENLPAKNSDKSLEVVRDLTAQFATFYFGEHFFGLPIEDVIEINRALDITPVPLAPEYVAGVVNLRGQILTAIHLGKRIGLAIKGLKPVEQLNNLIMGDREEPISLLVEQIGDVMAVPVEQIEAPPDLIHGVEKKYVKNVCKLPGRLLIILDSENLQASPGEKEKQQDVN